VDYAVLDVSAANERSANADINVRDVHSREDVHMSLRVFLAELETTPPHVQPGETRRLYGKDYPCPREWSDWLNCQASIPDVLLPQGTKNAMKNLPDPVSLAFRRDAI
jgi:hypothetical protein